MNLPELGDFYTDPIDEAIATRQYNRALRDRDRRDRFAAAALAGILSGTGMRLPDELLAQIAKASRELADVLIAELDKPT